MATEPERWSSVTKKKGKKKKKPQNDNISTAPTKKKITSRTAKPPRTLESSTNSVDAPRPKKPKKKKSRRSESLPAVVALEPTLLQIGSPIPTKVAQTTKATVKHVASMNRTSSPRHTAITPPSFAHTHSSGVAGCLSVIGSSHASSPSAKSPSKAVSLKAAPKEVSMPQPQRRLVVENNAYHCNFVQSVVVARGPEWKVVHRNKERLQKEDVLDCDFVWFKYEHIEGLPPVPLQTDHIDLDVVSDPQVRDAYQAVVIPVVPSGPLGADPSPPEYSANLVPGESSLAHFNKRYAKMPPRAPPPPPHSPQAMLHYQTMKQAPGGGRAVSCFQDSSAVWRKHRLYNCLKTWCDADPNSRGSIRERMPVSFPFNLHSDTATEDALRFMEAAPNVKTWLAKATGGANGSGIFVTEDKQKLVEYVASQEKRDSSCSNETDWWVIQEFLEHIPLLGDRRRFQIKMHCVTVASPVGFEVYVHKGQRVQLCQEPYDIANTNSFVGNWAQQKGTKDLRHDEYVVPLQQLAAEHPLLIPCWHRMKAIVADAVEAAYMADRNHFRSTPGCFDIMGWDFVVEEVVVPPDAGNDKPQTIWRPMLLEANHRPGYGSTRGYMEKLIQQAIGLVCMPIVPDRRMKGTLPTKVAELEEPWDHVRTIIVHPQSHAINANSTMKEELSASQQGLVPPGLSDSDEPSRTTSA